MSKSVIIDGEEYVKKENKDLTVHFILDNSGSMSMVQDATISSFNEYIQSLKKDKENTYKFQLTIFADDIVTKDICPIDQVEPLTRETYPANGPSTALYDAACMTIKEAQNNPGKNLVVILTDGEENSSREYNEKNFRDLVKKLEKKGNWTFTYLGANQDSYAVAQRFGFKKGNISNYTTSAAGMASVLSNLTRSTMFMAQSAEMNTSNLYTPEQQKEMEETK